MTDDQPLHVSSAPRSPLDGGAPRRLGDLAGPVLQAEWSPDSTLLATVCRLGSPDPEKATARGSQCRPGRARPGARLDGVGWHEGRRHLFVVDVGDGTSRQLTRGDFDHFDPSWSPDGSAIVFASDRTARRDDRQLRSDAWVVPSTGGRPGATGRRAESPTRPSAQRGDHRLRRRARRLVGRRRSRVHDSFGRELPTQAAGSRNRPWCVARPRRAAPIHWIGNRELVMLILDRGSFVVHRARMGDRSSYPVVAGDVQVDALAVRAGGTVAPASRTTIAFTESWPDRPGEVYATRLASGNPQRITHLNDELLDEVSLCRVERRSVAFRRTVSRSNTSLCRHLGGRGDGCRSILTYTAGRTDPGLQGDSSRCTNRLQPPATSSYDPTRGGARVTARPSPLPAREIGAVQHAGHHRMLRPDGRDGYRRRKADVRERRVRTAGSCRRGSSGIPTASAPLPRWLRSWI